MSLQQGQGSILMEMATCIKGRKILQHRYLRGETKVSFVIGLSDNTTIVATRKPHCRFDHYDHLEEPFDSVWRRLTVRDGDKETMQ